MFIIYGSLTEESVGELFLAGILPGLLLSTLFLVTIFVMCKLNPKLGPPSRAVYTWADRIKSLKGVWGMILLFSLVMGGLYIGIFAPSEAGAIGAIGAFIIGLARRRLGWKTFINALRETAKTTCMILTITIGAMIFNFFISTSGFGTIITAWIGGLAVSRSVILSAALIMYILLGMVMDTLAAILLTMPLVYPVLLNLGYDPIWFGVMIVIIMELGMITPPVGIMSYVVAGMTEIPLTEVFLGILPFVFAMIVGIALLIAFPQIALFIPSLM